MSDYTDFYYNYPTRSIGYNNVLTNNANIGTAQAQQFVSIVGTLIGEISSVSIASSQNDMYFTVTKAVAGDTLYIEAAPNNFMEPITLIGVTLAANTTLYRTLQDVPLKIRLLNSTAKAALASLFTIGAVQTGSISTYLDYSPPEMEGLTVSEFQSTNSTLNNGVRYRFTNFCSTQRVLDVITVRLPVNGIIRSKFNGNQEIERTYAYNAGTSINVDPPAGDGKLVTGYWQIELPAIGTPTAPAAIGLYDSTFTYNNFTDTNTGTMDGSVNDPKYFAVITGNQKLSKDLKNTQNMIESLASAIMELHTGVLSRRAPAGMIKEVSSARNNNSKDMLTIQNGEVQSCVLSDIRSAMM